MQSESSVIVRNLVSVILSGDFFCKAEKNEVKNLLMDSLRAIYPEILRSPLCGFLRMTQISKETASNVVT
jgi:hypothetical protein